ncbi:MAG: hypothetical protein B7Z52_05870, partial [Burkholderiales bacterium 12-64-5]
TQQNAALVEENNAAAQSLVHQAQALDSMMRYFRVDETDSSSSSSSAPAPRPSSSPALVKTSPARSSASANGKTAPKIASIKKTAAKSAAKTGTDREWEEF